MKKEWLVKTLAIGIIALFIGISIQPGFANEISINKTSDYTEDCGCQDINRAERVGIKLLFNQLKVKTNYILSKYRYIPGIKEKCEEILDIINLDLNWDKICELLDLFFEKGIYPSLIAIILIIIFLPIIFPLSIIWFLNCYDPPHPYIKP